MKHWKKKIVMALACMALTAMWSFSVYARAIDHTCVAVRGNEKSSTPWATTGDSYHERTVVYGMVCQSCYTDMHKEETASETQPHVWGRAEDMAHKGHFHKFRLYCGVCSGTREVEIICDFEKTGWHNTP